MSLINQMLKELDARSSEVTSMSQAYGGQIRAVAARRRIHPAWWLALILAVLLMGLSAWILLRPPAPPQPGAAAHLPLKVDFALDAKEAPAPNHHSNIPERSAITPAVMAPESADTATGMPNVETQVSVLGQAADNAARPGAAGANGATAVSIPKDVSDRTSRASKSVPNPENPKPVMPAKQVATDGPIPAEPAAQAVLAKQVKELTPQQRAENEYRKAVPLIQQGKTADAISTLEQALQFDAYHAAARQALIGLLLDTKRQEEAMQKAREGLALDPAQANLAMILARLQVEKNDLPSAIATLERSLQYGAGRADYQAFLAALLQRSGKHRQSAEHYIQAVQKAPQNGVWWMGLGISLQAENRSTEAMEAFKRAKASNALSPELLAFVESRLAELQH
ncbi:MAG: tetratricopeptide repeat protein [Bacillota bacterium]